MFTDRRRSDAMDENCAVLHIFFLTRGYLFTKQCVREMGEKNASLLNNERIYVLLGKPVVLVSEWHAMHFLPWFVGQLFLWIFSIPLF